MHLDCPVAKVTFVGESGAGKSCLVQRYACGEFATAHVPTIGVDYALRRLELAGDRYIRLQLWDTAGQERFRSITLAYYRGAVAVVLVHDRADPEHTLAYWLRQTREHAAPSCRVVVFGAKKELAFGEHAAERWAAEHSLPYYALSAKTGDGLEAAFATIEAGVRATHAAATDTPRTLQVAPPRTFARCCH